MTVSQWADEHRRLSESSAEQGRWRTDRAPYQRGIMDAFCDGRVSSVVMMTSAQVGKTEILLNVLGYFADQDPSSVLAIQPTLEMGEAFSKDRVSPMIRDCPRLSSKIADARSRDSGNTILHKRFPGGHWTITGSNSPASLASRPIRVVLGDEVDRWPASAGAEGDPMSLASKRTATFWNRKLGWFSTPTDEHSRIAKAYSQSDQREYELPCPDCGHMQVLRWSHVVWETAEDGTVSDDVWIACQGCGVAIEERHKPHMLRHGRWVARAPFRGTAGFWLNELYSPWSTWRQVRDAFLAAKDSPEMLKVWTNTAMAEVWTDDVGKGADWQDIAARRYPYIEAGKPITLPDGALYLTLAFDVQDDRLEGEIIAHGDGEESWGIEYVRLEGDPGRPELWDRASQHLSRSFQRADGAVLQIAACGVDSGGHYTQQVYAWARKHAGLVYAMKGANMIGRPIVEASKSLMREHGIRLYMVGTDTCKELIVNSRLQITAPGPGYCHFPASYPDEYFRMLCSEERKTRYSHGRPVYRWEPRKLDGKLQKRNEALDIRVMTLALIHITRPVWSALAAKLEPGHTPEPPKPKQSWVQPKRESWFKR